MSILSLLSFAQTIYVMQMKCDEVDVVVRRGSARTNSNAIRREDEELMFDDFETVW